VKAAPGIEEIALTTNGHLLAALAVPLRDAGVTRLNVSLDTLDAEKLHRIAGRAATLDRIVAGIEAARSAGFASVHLNVVVVRGETAAVVGDLARFAWRFGATARFIELMPFGPGAPVPTAEVKRLLEAQGIRLEPDATRGWGPAYHMRGTSEVGDLARFAWRFGATARFIELMPFGPGVPVPSADVKRLLEAQGIRLSPDATRGWGPAYHMRGVSEAGGGTVSGLVGFIGAMTEGFCDGCNRVRVGADGSLRACLGGRDRVSLASLISAGANDAEITASIREALLAKKERHDLGSGGRGLPAMIGTGG